MGFIGGLAGVVVALTPVALVVPRLTVALPFVTRAVTLSSIALCAALIGALAGAAVARRAWRDCHRLALFSALAGALGTGSLAAISVAVLTVAFQRTYGVLPADTAGKVLYVVAPVAFGATAWFLGAVLGAIAGLAGGLLLRGALFARR